jgi:3-oxoacyl-[acyl-carrier protein] reductase
MKDFNDKHIVVTGGVNGIGLGAVEVFVREGAKVSILDIDQAGRNSKQNPGERSHFSSAMLLMRSRLKKALQKRSVRLVRWMCW